jgi:hypothetical protein
LIRRQYEKERKISLCSKWQGLGAEGDKDNLKTAAQHYCITATSPTCETLNSGQTFHLQV